MELPSDVENTEEAKGVSLEGGDDEAIQLPEDVTDIPLLLGVSNHFSHTYLLTFAL